MKRHITIRVSILLLGFLLIFIYIKWDSWFNPHQSIGGNNGMSISEHSVYNIFWIISWCFLIFLEILISLFTSKNRLNRKYNVLLLLGGIVFLVIYILFFFK